MKKIVKAEITGLNENHLPFEDDPSVVVEYDNGEKGVLFTFNPWHYHAYVDREPGENLPFTVEEAIGLTAAQARARFRPDPPRSEHELWLRSVTDEFKQTMVKKNNVVDIRSRFKPSKF